MTDEELRKARTKMRDSLARLIRRKLRDMRRRSSRPRLYRLPKEARALKSLIAEAKLFVAPTDSAARSRPVGASAARGRLAHFAPGGRLPAGESPGASKDLSPGATKDSSRAASKTPR